MIITIGSTNTLKPLTKRQANKIAIYLARQLVIQNIECISTTIEAPLELQDKTEMPKDLYIEVGD